MQTIYRTKDGREFDRAADAERWEEGQDLRRRLAALLSVVFAQNAAMERPMDYEVLADRILGIDLIHNALRAYLPDEDQA